MLLNSPSGVLFNGPLSIPVVSLTLLTEGRTARDLPKQRGAKKSGMTNVMTREERTRLGHHVAAQTKAATTYNRDAQHLLQCKVITILDMIKDGVLLPDLGRAERLTRMMEHDRDSSPTESEEELGRARKSYDGDSSPTDSSPAESPMTRTNRLSIMFMSSTMADHLFQ